MIKPSKADYLKIQLSHYVEDNGKFYPCMLDPNMLLCGPNTLAAVALLFKRAQDAEEEK